MTKKLLHTNMAGHFQRYILPAILQRFLLRFSFQTQVKQKQF